MNPAVLARICEECNYGSFEGRCVITGEPGVADAYYCKECVKLEKDRDGCPKIINLGSARTVRLNHSHPSPRARTPARAPPGRALRLPSPSPPPLTRAGGVLRRTCSTRGRSTGSRNDSGDAAASGRAAARETACGVKPPPPGRGSAPALRPPPAAAGRRSWSKSVWVAVCDGGDLARWRAGPKGSWHSTIHIVFVLALRHVSNACLHSDLHDVSNA